MMILRVVVLTIFLLLIVNGCALKTDKVSKMTEHKQDTQELRLMMSEFNMLVNDNFKSELELDNIKRRHALTLADTIKELTYKIEAIPKDKLQKKISKENMELFSIYINKLRNKAKEIEEISQKYELEKLDSKIDELKNICISCHAKVRN